MPKTVFVSGCYDILHGGHVEFFEQARKLGDLLVVSLADDQVLELHKGRRGAIPVEHKKKIIESLEVVSEVVVSGNTKVKGLDFSDHFRRIRPDFLVVTDDDQFEGKKRGLCTETGCKYVKLSKTLNFKPISTSEVVSRITAPKKVPLRVDFAGGWLDVPRHSVPGGFIVNCAITPEVSVANWPYEIGSGLGGSAAHALLRGKDPVESELDLGVGWQDPAVIQETGLCVWRSGMRPVLEAKFNPDILRDRMYLLWTGKDHDTPSHADSDRDYDTIFRAGLMASQAAFHQNVRTLWEAVQLSYKAQLKEGMEPLPDLEEKAKKYCGGGFGGYALYVFDPSAHVHSDLIKVQPHMV